MNNLPVMNTENPVHSRIIGTTEREAAASASHRLSKPYRGILASFPVKIIALLQIMLLLAGNARAQTPTNITIPAGSLIINMGIVPQTTSNGMKPYGMIWDLLYYEKVPVDWVINTAKAKDGIDFSYGGVDYKGGTFIIEAQYRNTAVNTKISQWLAQGITAVTTTAPVTVPLYLTMQTAPRWTMDLQNGGIAVNFFNYAGFSLFYSGAMATAAYGGASKIGWTVPAGLDCCDDIFVMPHADPIWSTHGHLWDWVQATPLPGAPVGTSGCKSGVWLGCHAGSALENMFDNITTDGDPIDASQQTNFLVDKTANAVGGGPYSTPGNSLILWGDHGSGTLPYTFNPSYAGDPIAQYMGTTDAAQQNGSEQIYIPAWASSGWRPTTKVIAYDPDHPEAKGYPSTPMTHKGAVVAYGPAFGNTDNGIIMLEAAHNISGTAPANVAAMRAFFNYSYLSAWRKSVVPVISGLPDVIYSGQSYPVSYSQVPNIPPPPTQTYTTTWASSCGGSWTPNNTSASTTFIAPTVTVPTPCNISVTIVDGCGRTTFDNNSVMLMPCKLTLTPTVTQPSCYGGSNGSISLAVTGGAGSYNYNWTRETPAGSGSGSSAASPVVINNMTGGTYTITVTNTNNCTGSATVLVTQPPQLTATTAVTNAGCYGSTTGSVNLTVNGGTPSYTYLWSPGGATTEDLVNVAAGTYSVTITDSKGCTASATATVGQPGGGLTVPGVITHVSCYGGSDGAINVTATGGTGPYTYNWADLTPPPAEPEDRTGLAIGTYNVIVADANGCTATGSWTVTQPAALSLSVAITNPKCDAVPPAFDGTINITASGGTSPYTYDWVDLGTPGVFTDPEDRTGLGPGTYSVTVKDAKGCMATISATLVNTSTVPGPPTIISH